jgi:hypothetical protein
MSFAESILIEDLEALRERLLFTRSGGASSRERFRMRRCVSSPYRIGGWCAKRTVSMLWP